MSSAAVEACSPFQFGISMITEVTTVSDEHDRDEPE